MKNYNKDIHRYDYMLNLPHHVSDTRRHMEVYDRAAQFAPFAALTGHDTQIKEKARLTSHKIELDENSKLELNEKLEYIQENIGEQPFITFEYFKSDINKAGGKYILQEGNVKKIDIYERNVILTNGVLIPIDDLYDIRI